MEQATTPSLDQSLLIRQLTPSTLTVLDDILIYHSVDSTSDVLWQRLSDGKNSAAICLSETQTAGRGRRGDRWHSPATGNIYLSIYWPFAANTDVNGLTIAVGISLIKCLKNIGINNLQLKWPNDILYKRHKLAGILVESRVGKQLNTVIGIGLNVKLPISDQDTINRPTTSIQQLCTEVPCRNELAGQITNTMIETIQQFQTKGLASYIADWSEYDALKDQAIKLINHPQHDSGIARGINAKGELQYQVDNQLFSLSNSHISIKFAS